MSKELKAYFKIDHTLCLNSQNIKFGMDADEHIDCQNVDELVNCLETIKNALEEREAINNVNPSEALECLEKLKGMEISSMPFSDEYGTQEVDLNDIRKVGSQLNTDFREYTTTIKQALLKAEKNRKDLELIEEVRSGKTLIFVGKGLVMMNADKYHEYLKMEEEPISKKIKKCLKEQAQEPKHYLKWEDLEFKIENQEMFVLLNGSSYLLEYYTDGEEEFVMIKATHTTVFELLGERSDDKQFFNDLHLEMVEE